MPSDGIGDELSAVALVHLAFLHQERFDHFWRQRSRDQPLDPPCKTLLVRFCVLADIMQKPSQSRSFASTKLGSPYRRLVLDLEQVLP